MKTIHEIFLKARPDGVKESTLKEKYRIKKPIYSKPINSKFQFKKDLEIKSASPVGPSYDIVQMTKDASLKIQQTVKEYVAKEKKVRANDAKDEVKCQITKLCKPFLFP